MKYLAVGALHVYRLVISPLLPASCKFHPSCSEYALGAFRRYGFARGAVLATWRLLRCHPWSHGGVDHVDDQTLFERRPGVSKA